MISIDNNQPGQLMLIEIAFINVIKDNELAFILDSFSQASISSPRCLQVDVIGVMSINSPGKPLISHMSSISTNDISDKLGNVDFDMENAEMLFKHLSHNGEEDLNHHHYLLFCSL